MKLPRRRKKKYTPGEQLFEWGGEEFRIIPDYASGLFLVIDDADTGVGYGETIEEAVQQAVDSLENLRSYSEQMLEELS